MCEPPAPRLAYIGDVAVDPTYHGSMLLYRLLRHYPAGRLHLIEGNLFPARVPEGLPAVPRTTLHVGHARLLHSRVNHWYSSWLFARATARTAPVRSALNNFRPEAVLTVAHGYSWVTAAEFAREAQLPLHLIVHDDWPRMVPDSMRDVVDKQFAMAYRKAATRLCVSPFMAEEYARKYGVQGTVMMPGRSVNATSLPPAQPRTFGSAQPPVFAFAGSISSPGYVELLRRVGASLQRRQGELHLYGPITPELAASAGLALPNVRLAGLLSSADLAKQLRATADVLFVPMSFAAADQPNMRLSFPSKIADYTAVGVPLLIWGPEVCSAVQWARLNGGVAEVVVSYDQAAIDAAVDRLINDAEYRFNLAATAGAVGDRDFSPAAINHIFRQALATSAA